MTKYVLHVVWPYLKLSLTGSLGEGHQNKEHQGCTLTDIRCPGWPALDIAVIDTDCRICAILWCEASHRAWWIDCRCLSIACWQALKHQRSSALLLEASHREWKIDNSHSGQSCAGRGLTLSRSLATLSEACQRAWQIDSSGQS